MELKHNKWVKFISILTIITVATTSCGHRFDSDRADTKNNKDRFEGYLKVELTPDIKDIYCFGDFMGSDYAVLFSFTCDSTTIQRIIEKKGMELTDSDNDLGLADSYESYNFKWWNLDKIKEIKAYKKEHSYDFVEYLWYDKNHKEAFFLQYSS